MRLQQLFNSQDRKEILAYAAPYEIIIIDEAQQIASIGVAAKMIIDEYPHKTIILTGSMIPIEGFSPSDGPFNLGFAIANVEKLPAGVYVAMNGKIFTPEEIAKEISKGRFFSIFGKKER